MEKQYKISHKAAVLILKHLDEIPYKYVKDVIPLFERSLVEIQEKEDVFQEEGRTETGRKEADTKEG